ncbi:uncharacterized protein N7529_010316 [Penicillium soppii]|uniref:uncharacterized protein n=1 Tax=Penicillium soppii TaxID=69789 RepID=UPI0025475C5E|nr:uncharacterized protein N7529_010316 [Penicillium soppii]KAJ5856372.1 hypothetical protein N7529_010316 [Penicillium soppii]
MGQRHLPEPVDSDPACWVTVRFDERMVETHWDEDLVEFALLELQHGRGHIGHKSHHRLGCMCISLPITGVSPHDIPEIIKNAKSIAEGWLLRVRDKRVRLDRDRIFFKPGVAPNIGIPF